MSKRAEFFMEGRDLLAEPYHYLASGLDNIFLLNGVTEKQTDYGPMVHIENINGLHHAIGLFIIEKPELMEGAEFRFLRKQMQMSQAELAKLLGVTDQTVRNYENDRTGLGPADPFMRALYLLSILPEQTRVKVIKPLLEVHAQKIRQRLSELARKKIVECWREGNDRPIAA